MVKKKTARKSAVKKKVTKPLLDNDGNVASPVDVHDIDDPGDEVQRAFRYQYAYGVILLTGIARRKLPYHSIWCEHHDDFLTQRNGTFDSFQIKTRQPENGNWELTTEGFISAIKKFATLETRFPEKISRFKFVSNTRASNSTAKKKIHRSPLQLHTAVSTATSESDLQEPFGKSLLALAVACDTTTACLFQVFKRLDLIIGPSREDFETVVSHMHVAEIETCQSFPPYQLNAIRDELIQKVYDASSNFVADPARHWCCVNGTADNDPRIRAKQLFPSIVDDAIQAKSPPYFRYSPISTKTDQRLTDNNLTTLEKKLLRGDLRPQIETMRRRTISTEQHLLELAAAKPNEICDIRNQLESVVQGVCDDASLQTQVNGEISGPDMLRQVQQQLQKLSDEQPNNVHSQPYDCLVGMAGLLTEECSVWWSKEFDVQEAST